MDPMPSGECPAHRGCRYARLPGAVRSTGWATTWGRPYACSVLSEGPHAQREIADVRAPRVGILSVRAEGRSHGVAPTPDRFRAIDPMSSGEMPAGRDCAAPHIPHPVEGRARKLEVQPYGILRRRGVIPSARALGMRRETRDFGREALTYTRCQRSSGGSASTYRTIQEQSCFVKPGRATFCYSFGAAPSTWAVARLVAVMSAER